MLWIHKSKFLLKILRIEGFLGFWHIPLIFLMNGEKVKGFACLFSIGTLNFQRFGDFQGTFKRHLICYRCISILNLCERMNARQRILASLFISRASQNSPVLTNWWFGPHSRCHLLISLFPTINAQRKGGCICV